MGHLSEWTVCTFPAQNASKSGGVAQAAKALTARPDQDRVSTCNDVPVAHNPRRVSRPKSDGFMRFSNREPLQAAMSYLYDPIPLDKVGLDVLKEVFVGVEADPDAEFIYAQTSEQKRKAQILTARLDFLDEPGATFENGGIAAIKILLRALPPISVKGIGITLTFKAVVEGEKDAGIYATKKFLARSEELSKNLGAPILAGMYRFTYGEAANYFDARFTPVQMAGEWLQLQLRKHKDTNLADPDRIIKETLDVHMATVVEFDRLFEIL